METAVRAEPPVEECGVTAADEAVGWRALLNGEPDEPTFVSVFCSSRVRR